MIMNPSNWAGFQYMRLSGAIAGGYKTSKSGKRCRKWTRSGKDKVYRGKSGPRYQTSFHSCEFRKGKSGISDTEKLGLLMEVFG